MHAAYLLRDHAPPINTAHPSFLQEPPRLTRAFAIVASGTSILIEACVARAKEKGLEVTALDSDWKWWPEDGEATNEFQVR